MKWCWVSSTGLFFCWDASLRSQPPVCLEAQATWRGKEASSQQPAPTGRPVSEPGFQSSNRGSKQQEQRQATVLCPDPSSIDRLHVQNKWLFYATAFCGNFLCSQVTSIFINKNSVRSIPRHLLIEIKKEKTALLRHFIMFF